MKNKLASGLYPNLSSDEYHADPALGSSSLKTLAMKTPAHLKGEVRKESAAFDLGSAFHTLVLEPHKEHLIICGGDNRRGNAWRDAKADAESKGALILTQDEYDQVFRMRDALMQNPDCVDLLSGKTQAELSLFHKDEQSGVQAKIRPDLYNSEKNIIVDLKTCISAEPHAFAKACYDWGYAIQQAWYQRIWEGFHKKDLNGFFFLAAEKNPPYLTAIYQLDKVSLMEGYNLVQIGLAKYRQCKASNNWYGYERGIQQIRLPAYGFKTVDPLAFGMTASQPEEDWS